MKETTADEIMASIAGSNTKESLAIQQRIASDRLKSILMAVKDGEQLSVYDKLVYDCISQYAPFGGERHATLKDLKIIHDIVDEETEVEVTSKQNVNATDTSLNEIRLRKKG